MKTSIAFLIPAFALTFALISAVSAVASASPKETQKLNKKTAVSILDLYSSAKYITVGVEKSDEKLTLGTKTINKGIMKYSGGSFYLVLNSDKKTELFFKNQKLTLVDYPDTDFDKDGIRKVTIITKKTPAFLTGLINLFSDSKTFFNEFKIKGSEQSGDVLVLSLEPKMENLRNFKLHLDVKQKKIVSIVFVDDVDTMTSILFNDVNLKQKISKSTFEYKAQSSDQVVNQ